MPLPLYKRSDSATVHKKSGMCYGQAAFVSRWAGQISDDLLQTDFSIIQASAGSRLEEIKLDNIHDLYAFPEELNGLLHVHAETQIPESILNGPWTLEMEEHLHYLVRARASIDWINSTAGEIAEEVMKLAVNTRNTTVQFLLFLLGARDKR